MLPFTLRKEWRTVINTMGERWIVVIILLGIRIVFVYGKIWNKSRCDNNVKRNLLNCLCRHIVFAVLKSFFAKAYKRFGTCGGNCLAKQRCVNHILFTTRKNYFIFLWKCVTDSCPHKLFGWFGNNFCVDKCVNCRGFVVRIFLESTVGIVHYRKRGAWRTVWCNCRECEQRFVI